MLTVHPRGCGKHCLTIRCNVFSGGSSPRVRGTLERSSAALILRAVHPRGCGEHAGQHAIHWFLPGSSPRVRGTRNRLRVLIAKRRFIPAGAGNTKRTLLRKTKKTVHPRGCGEHFISGCWSNHVDGSSPRVRGTRRENKNSTKKERFIPAGAGNT